MRYRPLHSSWLDSVAYDPLTKSLTVRYRDGKVQRFVGVPQRIYKGLLSAESPGAYFNEWVRDRGYERINVSPRSGGNEGRHGRHEA